MSKARFAIPFLGLLALAVLFFKLPETPNPLGIFGCTDCGTGDPYLPLAGAAYFALLVALALQFPAFPGPLLARAGLVWAVLLALALSWLNLPAVCAACLIAHGCNLAIWAIWLLAPAPAEAAPSSSGADLSPRLYLALLLPVTVVALFSSLNLTFMAYGAREAASQMAALQPGDAVPDFAFTTREGEEITPATAASAPLALHFVGPDCPYCAEQLPRLNRAATNLAPGQARVINLSPELRDDLTALAPDTGWAEDTGGQMRAKFKVRGIPTLVVIGPDGRVAQVLAGAQEGLEAILPEPLGAPPETGQE